jgi:hypothetical protein
MRLIGLATGGVAGGLVFVIAHVLPDVALFVREARYYDAISYQSQSFSLSLLLDRINITLIHLRSWYALSIVEMSLVALGICAALVWSKRPQDKTLAAIFGLCLVGWIVLGSYPAISYGGILLVPGAALVGTMIDQIHVQTGRVFAICALLIAAILGLSTRRAVIAAQDGQNARFDQCLAKLQNTIPPTGNIIGDQLFWLARAELQGYAAKVIVEVPPEGNDIAGWWAAIHPDIVLWNGPVLDSGAQYLLSHRYTIITLPECAEFMTIWLKAGVTLQ